MDLATRSDASVGASLTRQTRLPAPRRVSSCCAAGLVLAALCMAASLDSYLFSQRIERAQLIEDLRAAELDRLQLSKKMHRLERALVQACAAVTASRATPACAPAASLSISASATHSQPVDRVDTATTTRGHRLPVRVLSRAIPPIHP